MTSLLCLMQLVENELLEEPRVLLSNRVNDWQGENS